VVNEAFQRRFFPDVDPLGQRLGIGGEENAGDYEVVGVVEDVKYTAPADATRPMIFLPAFQYVTYDSASLGSTQVRSGLMRAVVVHTAPGAGTLEGPIRRALAEVEPNLTIVRVLSHEEQVSGNFRMQRLMATLTSIYGLLALGLASLGLYGVTAYGVTQRAREIGVRMALGADRARIVRTVLASPLREVLLGLAIGLPAAYFAGEVIAAQLYEIGSRDPRVMGSAAVVLVAAAVIAAVLPALRASAIDPTRVLRGE
jgi:hypothetical protein